MKAKVEKRQSKLSARGVATRLSSARSKREKEDVSVSPPAMKPSAGVGLVAWSRGAGRN